MAFPHTFKDGVNETASGVAVMDNFSYLLGKIEALETLVKSLEAKVWTAATLAANWFGAPTGGQTPGYRLSSDKSMGELKGELRNQDGVQGQGETMFTLPGELHPLHECRAPCTWWNGSSFGDGTVLIRTNGEVVLEVGVAFGRVTIDGIRFPLT